MPTVILDSLQIVNGVALHAHKRINVTDAVAATLEARGAVISEDELAAIEAAEVVDTAVFETIDETPPTPQKPTGVPQIAKSDALKSDAAKPATLSNQPV